MKSTRLLTRTLATAIVVLLIGFGSRSFAEPLIHTPTGIVFPDEIGSFKRTNFTDFESTHPGQGVSYTYRSSAGSVASVYIYTKGLSNIPTSVDDPIMSQLREQTIGELHQFAQSKGASVNQYLKGIIPVKTNKGNEIKVFFDSFVIRFPPPQVPVASDNRLWPSQRYIFKIRMTHYGEANAKQNIEFANTIVNLSANSSDKPK